MSSGLKARELQAGDVGKHSARDLLHLFLGHLSGVFQSFIYSCHNEVLEHFQWDDRLEDRGEFAGELADVALYLLQIASVAGVDLEQAVLDKLEHNYQRTWDQSEQTSNMKGSGE